MVAVSGIVMMTSNFYRIKVKSMNAGAPGSHLEASSQNFQNVVRFVKEINKRVENWTECRLILESLGIPRSNGPDKTLTKLQSDFDKDRFQPSNVSNLKMRKVLEEISIACNKSVFLYEIDGDWEKISNNLFSDLSPDSVFAANFPFVATGDELQKIDFEPYFCGIIPDDGYTYYPFGTKRAYIQKTPINLNDLHADDKKILEKYSKVVGTEEIVEEFIDVVCVNEKNKILEIRIDKGEHVSRKDLEEAHAILRDMVVEKIAEIDKSAIVKEINIFNVIKPLYNKAEEGRVCELAFECYDDSLHTQHYRRERKDIRSQTFHTGGKIAIGDIDPFRMAVAWEIGDGEKTRELEAVFPGTRSMLRANMPYLSHFVIKKCLFKYDFNKIVEKIIDIKNEES